MVLLLTRRAPLRSSALVETSRVPPGLMVMREPPPLVRLFPELLIAPPLLMVIAPVFSKALMLAVLLMAREPAAVLKPPSQVRGAELTKLPPLVKLTRLVGPVATRLEPAKVVTPMRLVPLLVENVPGPAM